MTFDAVTPHHRRAKIPAIMPSETPPNPNEGHRRRLREKFLRAGISSLNDYEVVELLLSLGTPRTDCKERAKEAIKHFKGLRGVLWACGSVLGDALRRRGDASRDKQREYGRATRARQEERLREL